MRTENRVFDAFMRKVEENLPLHGNNQKETFHAVNDHFEQELGFKPYGSEASFKNAKSRRRKRNR